MSVRGFSTLGVLALGGVLVLLAASRPGSAAASGDDWAMNATVIEACSCPMFCQCYFNPKPAGHGAGGHAGHAGPAHFCRANNAYKVNRGHFGAVKLDGAKFWIAADLGDDFSDGEMEWAVLYFDKALSKEQRDGIGAIVGHLFPVKWKSLKTAEASIDKWEYTNDAAHALLDGGKTGEVKLKRFQGMTAEPVVLKNLPYWGAPRNDGFIMMPNEVEAYRVGPNAFEFKGTNGFMLTLDITSKDIAKKGP
jgi:Protein of unknown function (DUF1326)